MTYEKAIALMEKMPVDVRARCATNIVRNIYRQTLDLGCLNEQEIEATITIQIQNYSETELEKI